MAFTHDPDHIRRDDYEHDMDIRARMGELLSHTNIHMYLQANENIAQICRLAGIKDLRAKVIGSRNSLNTVKAAFIALASIYTPQELAERVGKPLSYDPL